MTDDPELTDPDDNVTTEVVADAAPGSTVKVLLSVTDNNNGTYSANFTGVTAGSATSIGATIAGVPVLDPPDLLKTMV